MVMEDLVMKSQDITYAQCWDVLCEMMENSSETEVEDHIIDMDCD